MQTEAGQLAALREVQAHFAEAVHAGKFQDAQAFEARRFALIGQLLKVRPAAATVRELAQIAAADRALLPQLEAAHLRCGSELRDLQRSRHAARAYAAPCANAGDKVF